MHPARVLAAPLRELEGSQYGLEVGRASCSTPTTGDQEDVHSQQLAATGVPADTLPEQRLFGRAGDGSAVLLRLSCHRQPPPKSMTTLMSSVLRFSASAMFSGGTRREISRPSQARSAAASASDAR